MATKEESKMAETNGESSVKKLIFYDSGTWPETYSSSLIIENDFFL